MFIITGGGSGIGQALAKALAQRAQSVLIVGRTEKKLQATAASSDYIHYVCADVASVEGLDAISKYCQSMQQIDGLVNNAGVNEPIVLVKDIAPEVWQQMMRINLDAALFLSQRLYHKLANGRVLNISSGAAYFPIRGWAAYCVSKAALSMLTRCCQEESDTVAFASVKPGIIDTHMQEVARSELNLDRKRVAFYKNLKQQNKLLRVETVAEFLCWLLLEVDRDAYVAEEWDIYDTKHHKYWLKPPHQVPRWDV